MSSYCERFFNEPLDIVPHEPYRWMQDLWYREPCKTSLVQIVPVVRNVIPKSTDTHLVASGITEERDNYYSGLTSNTRLNELSQIYASTLNPYQIGAISALTLPANTANQKGHRKPYFTTE